jgi:hypothetical protein
MICDSTFRTSHLIGDLSDAGLPRNLVVSVFACNLRHRSLAVGQRCGLRFSVGVVLSKAIDRHREVLGELGSIEPGKRADLIL